MPGHADHVLYDLLIRPVGGKLRFARAAGAMTVAAARGVAVEDVSGPFGGDAECVRGGPVRMIS